uniref:Fucosyltransferase n=1 Tax=Melopsittacus undulatus TaxID=13146 RepID=A0A8V5FSV7_MELUD
STSEGIITFPLAFISVHSWPFGRPAAHGRLPPAVQHHRLPLSADRSSYGEAQAVLFHHRDLALHGAEGAPRGPPPRPPQQALGVDELRVAPRHSPGLRGLAGLFNWTMSYRRDSDVFVPYGYLYTPPAPRPFVLAPQDAAGGLGHQQLERGARPGALLPPAEGVPRHRCVWGTGAGAGRGRRWWRLSRALQVYLAFENSQHNRLQSLRSSGENAFAASAVPRFIPRDSFIHVDDFPSPRLLATYLKFLDKNKPNYRKYFAWRKKYEVHVTSFWDEHLCKACQGRGGQLGIKSRLYETWPAGLKADVPG